MIIEKINENQIKCILDKQELDSRQIQFSELAQSTEKTRLLFQDIMKLAAAEFGFYVENSPLMIEAIPAKETVTLIVTKVKNIDELDSKIPRISYDGYYDEEFSEEPDDFDYYMEDMEEINDIEDVSDPSSNELLELFRNLKKKLPNTPSNSDTNFVPLSELLRKQKAAKKDTSAKNIFPDKMIRIYSFEHLDTIIKLSHYLKNIYHGQNSLYKSQKDNRYYLILNNSSHTIPDFAIICTIISEFGKPENSSLVSEAYYKEHFQKIISKNALQNLQKLQ